MSYEVNSRHVLTFMNNREVPEYSVREYRERSSKNCVVIFVINEGERLLTQLDRMHSISSETDVIVADGGSVDGSVSDSNLMPRGVNVLLVKEGPGKLSAQMRMAFDYALDKGYEGVITIDGNNKDDPEAIPLFIAALAEGYDHLQGSRFIKGGKAINTPWSRYIGVRMIHAPLISYFAGYRYTDTTNGFRAYSRRFLEDPAVNPFRKVFNTYEMHYYLAIRAAETGYRIAEIPVTRAYPTEGPTPTKISSFSGKIHILDVLRRACLHKFDPKPDVALDNSD